jgi:hypothetical protein
MKHILFLKWWLLITLIGVGAYFCNHFGVFQEVYHKDVTKLSFVILAAFAGSSIQCGVKTFKLDKALTRKNPMDVRKIKNGEDIGWFLSAIFTSLGLIGTVIGMIVALQGFVGIDATDPACVQTLIGSLVLGISTALYSTLSGLICSTLLKLQYFNISSAITKSGLLKYE